jgi:predicted TIM-barrel fold metal-dependent hydrolase
MRTIAIEEHVLIDPLRKAMQTALGGAPAPSYLSRVEAGLVDVGAARLADMDAAGIDVQVLSWGVTSGFTLEKLPPAEGIALAFDCNDAMAEVVRTHPDRYAGFAILPLQEPEAAAAELERAVTKLGMKGTLINGTINGHFLDDAHFRPILAAAEALGVPIYLHPAPPPPAVFEAYYHGLPAEVAGSLARAGWGWHVETGLHSLRLVVAGVFDRYPKLQVIIGHMGENLPFSLARADDRLTPAAPYLQRRVADYLRENFYITTSGYFTAPPLICALLTFGADRLIFAVDYPFSPNAVGRAFLDSVPISEADREKIAFRNAERLLGL